MGCNPNDPLTTTNSSQESAMANAYSKTRPKKLKQYPEVELILDNKPDLPQEGQPYMPWMRAIDAHFEMFGFLPGDRVYLVFNFDLRIVTIKPDRGALDWREQPYGAAAQKKEQA